MNPFPEDIDCKVAGMIDGRRHILVLMPFRCITSLGVIVVPANTLCDGASIPRIMWPIIGHPLDEYLEDAVLHDFLYSPTNTDFSRAEADLIFRETMWNRDISRPKLIAMYAAVRAFGWRSFQGQPQ
jgi:hypothetical protein